MGDASNMDYNMFNYRLDATSGLDIDIQFDNSQEHKLG